MSEPTRAGMAGPDDASTGPTEGPASASSADSAGDSGVGSGNRPSRAPLVGSAWPPVVAMADGATLPVDGEPVRLRLLPDGPRTVRLREGELVLKAGSPAGPRLSAWMKLRLRDRLAPLAHEAAGTLGRRIAALSFRDTRSRWGSCSSAGRISLSWRLAMAPRAVQDYVALHEVAHLAEMNHSHRFWAVMARLMPDYEAHRGWLREEGRKLHAYRFDLG